MANERKEFERYILDCFYKVTKMVLQARNLGAPIPGETDLGFNLETEQMSVSRELTPWIHNWYTPLAIDIYLTFSKASTPVLLERWKVVLDPPTHVTQSTPFRKIAFVIVMRSLYSALRLLPAYKLVRGLRKNKMAIASFGYKLGQPEFNSAPFSKDVAAEFRFGVIDTPFGQLSMSVEYKKDPGVKMSDLVNNPISSKVIIADYVPPDPEERRAKNVSPPNSIPIEKPEPIGIPIGGTAPIAIGGTPIGVTPPVSNSYSTPMFSTRFGTPLLSTSPTIGKDSLVGGVLQYTPPTINSVTPPFSSLLVPASLATSYPSTISSKEPPSRSPPNPVDNPWKDNLGNQETLPVRLSLFGVSPPQQKEPEAKEEESTFEEAPFGVSSSSYGDMAVGTFYRHINTASPLKLFEAKSVKTIKSLFDELDRLKKEEFGERKKAQ